MKNFIEIKFNHNVETTSKINYFIVVRGMNLSGEYFWNPYVEDGVVYRGYFWKTLEEVKEKAQKLIDQNLTIKIVELNETTKTIYEN